MPEDEIVDCVDLILESIKLFERRYSKIRLPGEFVQSANGITLLDAITMRPARRAGKGHNPNI